MQGYLIQLRVGLMGQPRQRQACQTRLEAVKGGNQMDPRRLLQIIQPMLAGFKLEITKMRSEGATQAEIDLMLDEFDEVYAHDDEGKLVIAVLRQAARPSCSVVSSQAA
jgi:hypothetical protein